MRRVPTVCLTDIKVQEILRHGDINMEQDNVDAIELSEKLGNVVQKRQNFGF